MKEKNTRILCFNSGKDCFKSMLLIYSMVKYLLDSANSMDLNCQDNYGNTPLHAACEDGSIDVAKVLITAGKVRFHGVESYRGDCISFPTWVTV